MTFEDAMREMRLGKYVIFEGRSFPLCIVDGRICEQLPKYLEPLDSMNTCNIMRTDWKIWERK